MTEFQHLWILKWIFLFCVDSWGSFYRLQENYLLWEFHLPQIIMLSTTCLFYYLTTCWEEREGKKVQCFLQLSTPLVQLILLWMTFQLSLCLYTWNSNVRIISQHTSRGKIQILECSIEQIILKMLSRIGKIVWTLTN